MIYNDIYEKYQENIKISNVRKKFNKYLITWNVEFLL